MNLYNVKIGDKLVYSDSGAWRKPIKATVVKVTKTQVTLKGETVNYTARFNKRDGRRIGDSDSWYPVRVLCMDGGSYGRELMTWERADELLAQKQEQQYKNKLKTDIKKLLDKHTAGNGNVFIDIEVLQQVKQLLENVE